MSGDGEGRPPTPLMMPRRRPVIPAAPRHPARSAYLVAAGIPRRGVQDAVVLAGHRRANEPRHPA